MKNTERAIRTLQMIADDMQADATAFEGRPFNGRTVAEYFGNQGAAISALANILKLALEEPGLGDAVARPVSNEHELSTREKE